ncbi:hypothetical protein EV424DRAFT_1448624 [Suillus variegatus]|nr:hypothetical protein EV424DRAFT_1448624 [Suillus variegatus]
MNVHLSHHSCSTPLHRISCRFFRSLSLISLSCIPCSPGTRFQDDVFSFHLLSFHDEPIAGHPSRIVFAYTCPWWRGNNWIPDQPWQWDEIMASCVSHYQYWALNVEDDALVLPEKLRNTSTPPLMGLRFIKERMEALLEEQDQGIKAKMGEVKMYTDMLEKLRKGKGV